MKSPILLIFLAIWAAPLSAQSWRPNHVISVGVGAGTPSGDLRGAFTVRPALSVNYGLRVARYLQADVGLDTVFGAAGVEDYVPSAFGDLRIRDAQILLPFGARLVLPASRFEVSAGGGAAYMTYNEHLQQPSEYFDIQCRQCRGRSGWGYYGVAGASVAVDPKRMFWVGGTSRLYFGHTAGEALGPVPGVRTRDRWTNIALEFLIHF